MVAPFDLTRYRPPLAHLQDRANALIRLIDGDVDPNFVGLEIVDLLRELTDFARSRFPFGRLEAKLRAFSSADVENLEVALDVIEKAPQGTDPRPSDLPDRIGYLRQGITAIRDGQHRWRSIETLLRLELALEGWLTDAIMAIAPDWDPQLLLKVVRPKVAALSDQQRADLWSHALAEHRPTDDPDLYDYRLVDYGVLPSGFLVPAPHDIVDRLALYVAWLRPQVIGRMLLSGRLRYPVPAVGLARLLSLAVPEDAPTSTDFSIARAVGNLAGWLRVRGEKPMSVEQLARLLAIDTDSRLLQGEESQDFAKASWKGSGPERAIVHSLLSIATGIETIHGREGPLDVALFQYKAGIELHAGTPEALQGRNEVQFQKHLCKFLLERGIFAVGTKFGQHETDLVASVGDEYIVIECKVVVKTMPSVVALERNLNQLLKYDDLNPAFRGRRGILVLYNFTKVPIIAQREPVSGTTWLLAVNANSGPPSGTRRSVQIVSDPAHALRCIDLGFRQDSAVEARPRARRRRAPRPT